MKKFVFIAMAVMIISSCTKEEDISNTDNSPVEIKLHPGIFEVQTKAPVNSGDTIVASFVASVTNGDYTTNAWSATARFKASATPSSSLSFSPQQYYPIEGSNIYIKGYYPSGTLSGKTVTFSGTAGTNDVMISNQASGTRSVTSALNFVFNHLLAQLQFKFVSGTGYPASGKSVTSVKIKTQQIPTSLDLNTGVITYSASDVTISGTYPITSAGSTATDFPMIKPGEVIILSVTNSDGVTYPDITFPTATLLTTAGQSHLITLTFTTKEITASVSVTDWVPGGTGSSSLQ